MESKQSVLKLRRALRQSAGTPSSPPPRGAGRLRFNLARAGRRGLLHRDVPRTIGGSPLDRHMGRPEAITEPASALPSPLASPHAMARLQGLCDAASAGLTEGACNWNGAAATA